MTRMIKPGVFRFSSAKYVIVAVYSNQPVSDDYKILKIGFFK